jgi:hypothetical protein
MTANDRVDFPTIDLCIKNAMVWRKKEGSPDCNLSGQPRKRESVRHSRGQLSYRFGKKDSSNNSKSTSQPRATNRKKKPATSSAFSESGSPRLAESHERGTSFGVAPSKASPV